MVGTVNCASELDWYVGEPVWPLFYQLPSEILPNGRPFFTFLAEISHHNIVWLRRLKMGKNGTCQVRFPMPRGSYVEERAAIRVSKPISVDRTVFEPFTGASGDKNLVSIITLGPAA